VLTEKVVGREECGGLNVAEEKGEEFG